MGPTCWQEGTGSRPKENSRNSQSNSANGRHRVDKPSYKVVAVSSQPWCHGPIEAVNGQGPPRPASGTSMRALLALASPNIYGNPDMTDAIRPLIAGNWKMNGLKSSLDEFEAMLAGAAEGAAKADLLVCPPGTLIASFAEAAGGSNRLAVGAQDCHPKASGAHTGDISAEMLADAGASAIIVGHSERRADHGETDVLV